MNSSGGQSDKAIQMQINNLNVSQNSNRNLSGLIRLFENKYLNTNYNLNIKIWKWVKTYEYHRTKNVLSLLI